MRVDNIFELINKFGKEEDQISAAFGFILKNNRRILRAFLDTIKVNASPKELKKVDIETQVPYDSGKSRIDLQISLYDKFLVFVESKLYKNEVKILEQLEKYKEILEGKRAEYGNDVRLVYVNKHPVETSIIQQLREKLELPENEFLIFPWEGLIRLSEKDPGTETVRLFKRYVGDSMYARRQIDEEKIKEIAEVLVIFTNPQNWRLVNEAGIAVQRNGSPDARYLAFLLTHRENKQRAVITHVARIEYVERNVPSEEICKGRPYLRDDYEKRRVDMRKTHKYYHIDKKLGLVALSKEIPLLQGERQKGQVNFSTTFSELLRAPSIGQIRTSRQLNIE
jgi:hypothetical protein